MTAIKLDDQYWTDRYQTGATGWDIGEVSTPIKEYVEQLTNKNLRILIPGCGNAHEASFLYQQGFSNITLIDISEWLVNKLKQQFQHTTVQVLHEDFFLHEGQYDLIIEQTLFCAINPEWREKYAAQISKLLAPNGKIAGVLFNCHFEGGPPFGGSIINYRPLLEKHLHVYTLEPCYNSIPPRAGKEAFLIAGLKNKQV